MIYCKRCLYPANHPLYITFDEEGVCSGCRIHEEKDRLPWDERFEKLGRILESYRNKSGNSYDCIIPVRGGGDSYFITHVVTKFFKMNPLLVYYNSQFNTKVGIRNLANLYTAFDCDGLTYTLDPQKVKRITRHSLKKLGSMYWPVLAGTQTFPVQIAVKFKIPLIIWGVNGWADQVGMFSHLDEVEMTKKARKEHALMCADAEDMVDEKAGISRRDVQPFVYPFDEELEKVGVRGIYLSNYIRWDSKKQHELMIEKYGYETAVQDRTFNTYEDVECFNSAGTHDYIKYLKYGYGKATDHATREIRLKRMTREEGIAMAEKYDAKKPEHLPLFLKWLGISEEEFYRSVDPFRDPRVWQKEASGNWRLLDSVANHGRDEGIDKVRLEKIEDCKFIVTPSREPQAAENEYILMGRGYIDKNNFRAVEDNQDEIQSRLEQMRETAQAKANTFGADRAADIDLGKSNRSQYWAPVVDNISGEKPIAFTEPCSHRELPPPMEYCSRCVMPNTKPGVTLDDEGVCSACRSVAMKKDIDWEGRGKEFTQLCDAVRGSNGNGYDCLVPVSGGKDSQYQVWMAKMNHHLNILAVVVVPHLQTREGIANLNTLVEGYGVDLIKVHLKPSVFKAIRTRAFTEMGEPNWTDHCSVMSGVTRMAYIYHIPLIIWGEDVAVEFGGTTSAKPKASAHDINKSDLFKNKSIEYFYDEKITAANTFFYRYPAPEDWEKRKIRSVYIGYFHFWDGYNNYEISKKFGFQARRLGNLSGNALAYDNIDEKLCEINIWFKFLKFGFWRPTDQCCYQIWNGRMTREEAAAKVNAKQYEFPVEYWQDFLEFQSMSEETFWQTVDKFRNRNIWHKVDGRWELKAKLTNEQVLKKVGTRNA